VFGDNYVSAVTGDTLMGVTTQSQYTDWMANTLFVTTDEVLPDGEEGTSMAWRRKKAYEKLKERIDPKARRMNVIRKSLPNYQDWVYASFLMATNHNNAIPIPEGDRRLAVLTNGIVPLAQVPELMDRLNEQRNPSMNPRFIACLAMWLDQRDVTGFEAHVAPDFSGKKQMQDANVTEIEGFIDDVLEAIPFDWATLDTVLDRVENSLQRANVKDNFPHWRKVATDRVKSRWEFLSRAYVDLKRTSKRTILTRTPVGRDLFASQTIEEKAAQYKALQQLDHVADDRARAIRAGLSVVR
jgi:hypothetical protein